MTSPGSVDLAVQSHRRYDAAAGGGQGGGRGSADVYQEVRRDGRIFVGLRVDLAKVTKKGMQELIEDAWRNRAPKRLVAEYDSRRGPSTAQVVDTGQAKTGDTPWLRHHPAAGDGLELADRCSLSEVDPF